MDRDRIYLTGGSTGVNGVWEIGVQYPERFAALVPRRIKSDITWVSTVTCTWRRTDVTSRHK